MGSFKGAYFSTKISAPGTKPISMSRCLNRPVPVTRSIMPLSPFRSSVSLRTAIAVALFPLITYRGDEDFSGHAGPQGDPCLPGCHDQGPRAAALDDLDLRPSVEAHAC